MKKLAIISILFISLFYLVHASTIEVDTVNPNIIATFNESVVLQSYNLTNVASSEDVSLNYTSSDNKTFVFNPISALSNGFYAFLVDARDRIGNSKSYNQNLLVSTNETKIFFISPPHGYSLIHPFNLTLGTSRKATCRWSFSDINYSLMPNSSFSVTGNLEHKMPVSLGIPDGTPEASANVFVKCMDDRGLPTKRMISVGVDNTQPSILASSVSPSLVISYPPITNISVTLDDPSICYIDGGPFNTQNVFSENTYSMYPLHQITYPATISSNGVYNYQIRCENLAGISSQTSSIQVKVDLKEKLAIYANSPKQFSRNPLSYEISTNKEANCTAVLDGANTTSLGRDVAKMKHMSTTLPTLLQGNHNVLFNCIGLNEVASLAVPFSIDDTPPSNLSLSASICSGNKLSLKMSAVDNQSGISGYNYSISGGNISVNSTFTSESSVEITNLKFVVGTTYAIRMVATNKVGQSSPEITTSFPYTSNATACVELRAPTISFNITNTTGGKRIILQCNDESGCIQSSIGYGLSSTNNCSIQRFGTDFTITSSQLVCYTAEDIFHNRVNGSQRINVASIIINETRAPPVQAQLVSIGNSCLINSDCISNYCKSGVCAASSCNDTIKNGLESDVDCGGSCEKCSTGKSCKYSSDCSSGSCEFSTCSAGAPTFEDWAKKYNINPADRDADPDADGLSNYQEFISGTDPFNADTDGDGVDDGKELKDGTDPLDSTSFAESNFARYLLLSIGLVVLLLGGLFIYFFKTDSQTSTNMLVIGGAALLFVIIDILLFSIPKPILYLMAVLVLGGAGYIAYTKQDIIVRRINGKSQLAIPPQQVQSKQQTTQGVQPVIISKQEEAPLSKEELTATKEMIEMIRKEKAEREKMREKAFSAFTKSGKESVEKQFEELEKIEVKKKLSKPEQKEVPKQQSSKPIQKQITPVSQNIFDKLSSVISSKPIEKTSEKSIEDLSKLKEKDVFSKLPSSKKSIRDLEELEKRKKKK